MLYLDGAPAGFFDINPHQPDETEIAYFGMMEHATGLGLGRWFLGAAIEAAWATEPKQVVVQTCTLDHPAALPLYQKLGFSPVGQKREEVQPLPFEERSRAVMRPWTITGPSARIDRGPNRRCRVAGVEFRAFRAARRVADADAGREFGIPRRALDTVGYGEVVLLVPTQNENWRNRRVTLRRFDGFLTR